MEVIDHGTFSQQIKPHRNLQCVMQDLIPLKEAKYIPPVFAWRKLIPRSEKKESSRTKNSKDRHLLQKSLSLHTFNGCEMQGKGLSSWKDIIF